MNGPVFRIAPTTNYGTVVGKDRRKKHVSEPKHVYRQEEVFRLVDPSSTRRSLFDSVIPLRVVNPSSVWDRGPTDINQVSVVIPNQVLVDTLEWCTHYLNPPTHTTREGTSRRRKELRTLRHKTNDTHDGPTRWVLTYTVGRTTVGLPCSNSSRLDLPFPSWT